MRRPTLSIRSTATSVNSKTSPPSATATVPILLVFTLLLATMVSAVPSVLVFSRTSANAYRHESIPTAIRVLGELSGKANVAFTFSEDPTLFTVDNLSKYDAILFLMMQGVDVLDASQLAALKTYFQSGGVYVGVHSSTAALDNSTTYLQAAGAFFDYHPPLQDATFIPLTKNHPATANFPDRWTFQEEVYYFKSDPRSLGATVLVTVDESSYVNNGTSTGNFNFGSPHPISWYIESPQSSQPLLSGAPKAGRSFYTSLGHLDSTWQNQTFQDHLLGGLSWALAGNSTRASGVGLVGNSTTSASVSGTTPSSTSNTASASGSSTTRTGVSSSAVASAPSSTNSKSAALDDSVRLSQKHGKGQVVGAVVGGMLTAVLSALR